MRYDFEILTGVKMCIQVYLYAFEDRAGNLITGISRTNRIIVINKMLIKLLTHSL